jgi:hypothetical protein
MSHVHERDLGPILAATAVVGSLVLLSGSIATGRSAAPLAAVFAATVVALTHKAILRWHVVLAATVAIVLIIPIKRYQLPGNLPFDLEPYRLMLLVVLAGWLGSLLVDSRVRLVKSGFEGPIFLVVATSIASVAVNAERVADRQLQSDVVKGLMFLISYFLLLYVVVSVIVTHRLLDHVVRVIVVGGAIVGLGAIIEYRTGFNVFDRAASAFPLLSSSGVVETDIRAGESRVFASAQGPIPLGAMLALLLPLGVYEARRCRSAAWWTCCGLMSLGALASLSRTTVVMLAVVGLVFVWLRPRQTLRLWPALVPAVIVIQAAVPGTIGTLHSAFFPSGGLISEQSRNPGWQGSGRLADLGPALDEFSQRPILGQGFETRLTDRTRRLDQILDNQWLKTLLETGIVGAFAWTWLFGRSIRRLGRAAKEDDSDRAWLFVAIAAALAAFAVGMFLYDTFSFVQVTFMAMFLLSLGAAALRLHSRSDPVPPQPKRPSAIGVHSR